MKRRGISTTALLFAPVTEQNRDCGAGEKPSAGPKTGTVPSEARHERRRDCGAVEKPCPAQNWGLTQAERGTSADVSVPFFGPFIDFTFSRSPVSKLSIHAIPTFSTAPQSLFLGRRLVFHQLHCPCFAASMRRKKRDRPVCARTSLRLRQSLFCSANLVSANC